MTPRRYATAIFNARKRFYAWRCVQHARFFLLHFSSLSLSLSLSLSFSSFFFITLFYFWHTSASRCVIRDPNQSEATTYMAKLESPGCYSVPQRRAVPTIIRARSSLGWDDRNLYNARNGFSSIPGTVGKRMTDPFEARDSSFWIDYAN